jgi:carbamoyltransferase
MRIIGTNFMGHDSALFYIDTKAKEIFAMSTERVTRIKHDSKDVGPILEHYPFEDVEYVCQGYGNFDAKVRSDLTPQRVIGTIRKKAFCDLIQPTYIKDLFPTTREKYLAFFESFQRDVEKTLDDIEKLEPDFEEKFLEAHAGQSDREILESYMREVFAENGIMPKAIEFYDHHLSHAAGAYYFSPYAYEQRCLSLTLDGWGDGYFGKAYLFENDNYELVGESPIREVDHEGIDIDTSHDLTSIGILYGNFTEALGLRRYSDEGKVEALAAFAEKNDAMYRELIEATIVTERGMDYDPDKIKPFYDKRYLKEKAEELGDEVFAATIQTYLEDAVVQYVEKLGERYPDIDSLCLSGGVAANIIMNLNIFERTKFKNLYIFPPMGDEGVAVGAALLKAVEMGEDIHWVKEHYMPYFGNQLGKDEIEEAIDYFSDRIDAKYIGEQWPVSAGEAIANNKIVAVVQGRMEFGPRALGDRSILANPVDPEIRTKINLTVKRRPKYQPFCPSILEEERERLFIQSFPHKHMAIGFRIKEEYHDDIPSAIHVDGTARPQFVEEQDNPNYYRLLKTVKEHTGFGVIINTSFNLHGRTIVHTAKDALLDFIDCNIEELYIEGYRITRK